VFLVAHLRAASSGSRYGVTPRFDRIADRRAIKRGVKRGRLSIEITGTGFEFWAKDAKIRASFFISDSTKF
jgi:hypothetical protein